MSFAPNSAIQIVFAGKEELFDTPLGMAARPDPLLDAVTAARPWPRFPPDPLWRKTDSLGPAEDRRTASMRAYGRRRQHGYPRLDGDTLTKVANIALAEHPASIAEAHPDSGRRSTK
jgi:hypothetical protein